MKGRFGFFLFFVSKQVPIQNECVCWTFTPSLSEHGATSLGPAVLASVAVASRYPGSKVSGSKAIANWHKSRKLDYMITQSSHSHEKLLHWMSEHLCWISLSLSSWGTQQHTPATPAIVLKHWLVYIPCHMFFFRWFCALMVKPILAWVRSRKLRFWTPPTLHISTNSWPSRPSTVGEETHSNTNYILSFPTWSC